MQDLLTWLASLKGVEIEPGTSLRLELSNLPQGGLALLTVLGTVAVLVAIFAIYRRDAGKLGGVPRLVLASLRCAALLVALLVVLEPNLVAVKKEERPGHTILLLDVSQSMAHQDAFRRAQVGARADGWRAAGVADPAAVTRLDLAKAALTLRGGALAEQLSARNNLKAYAFAAGVEPLELTAEGIAALQPDGRYSNLGGAVRAALERSREAAIAGVVILSDGRRNMGPQGAEIARFLLQRKVPRTLVLPVGDPSETQSVELTRIEVPDKVFQRDPFRISAQLAAQGYDLGSVTVRLLKQGEAGGEVIATQQATLGGDAPDATVVFDELKPDEPGSYTYRVEIEPPAGEPRVEDRHAASAQVEVLSERVGVLLVAGGPSPEYRVLQITLTRDKTIDLRCWLTSADPSFPQDGNTSIEALPADLEAMEPIDVIVLLDPDPAKLTPEWCAMAARHVVENGAGLWWVCGEKYTLDALRDTASTRPLAELLPVVPDMVRADQVYQFGQGFHQAWPWLLTADGEKHPLTRLEQEPDRNQATWAQLPGYHLAFPVLKPKPAATSLIELKSPLFARPGEATPLFARHFVGAGRALFLGTDETYRWRGVFQRAYEQFWVEGIRDLFEGRLVAGNSRLRIRVAEERVELGAAVPVTVLAKDDNYQPLLQPNLELVLARQGGAQETVRFDAVAESPGEYRAVLRPRQTGFYTLGTGAPGSEAVRQAFQVVSASVEREGPVDLAELEDLASVAGGAVLDTPAALLAAVADIPSMRAVDTYRTPHPVWDTWITIAVLLSLLSLEWWLRKRFNLL